MCLFGQDRIFKRLRTFEGRNAMQFHTYLSYYVLRDLFLEWRRTLAQVDTVSLDAPLTDAQGGAESTRTAHEVLPTSDPTPAAALEAADETQAVARVLEQLEPERRLILKLLALGTVDLTPEDVRLIAQLTSRSIRQTLTCLEEASAALVAKALKTEDKWHTFHTVAYWIQTYQRQAAVLQERIQVGAGQSDAGMLQKWTHEKAELERKLAWRYEQQARLREELQKSDVRPSYKDIATILNLPLGTICSKIARAREEFGQKLATARVTQT
jgi:DNA-directed RNA polymerase specialized sigma24 family protein